MNNRTSDRHGKWLGAYLLGKEVPEHLLDRYHDALKVKNLELPESEQALWQLMERNSWARGPIDTALAWKRPNSVIRQRLVLMLAILEATPEYADKFLPQRQSWFYLFRLGMSGFGIVFNGIFGLLILALKG